MSDPLTLPQTLSVGTVTGLRRDTASPGSGTFESNLKEYKYVPATFIFPGGTIKLIPIGAMPGNLTFPIQCPMGFRWKFLSAWLRLVCDATVANRILRFSPLDANGELSGTGYYGATATASQTKDVAVICGPWVSVSAGGVSTDASHSVGDLIIDGGEYFSIAVSNGVAGDRMSGRLRVLEIRL